MDSLWMMMMMNAVPTTQMVRRKYQTTGGTSASFCNIEAGIFSGRLGASVCDVRRADYGRRKGQ